ncbi:MAG: hypothetical protein M4579_000269 [Chaenotheca gracillima]|nr:MAG: hypothetical protein M4579_000269 [Chaenotheca gracillima]
MVGSPTPRETCTTDFDNIVEQDFWVQTAFSGDHEFDHDGAGTTWDVKSNDYEDIILAPPPKAAYTARPTSSLTRERSPFKLPRLATTLWNQDSSDNSRQSVSSWSNPFTNATHSPQRSPQRSPVKEELDFFPTLTGDTTTQISSGNKRNDLSSWFKGTSAPITLGVLVKDEPVKMDSDSPSPRPTSPPKLHRKTTSQSILKQAPALASRFSFFSSKSTSEKVETPSLSDEFSDLDIGTVLFPHGPAEPFSPSSFKNLQMNAEGALTKIQTAYKLQNTALRDAVSSKVDLQDQLEEAETRAKHLKMQLDNMAVQAAEQEQAMKELSAELALEKRRRHHDEEARKRTIMLVKKPTYSVDHEDAEENSFGRTRSQKRSSQSTVSTDSNFDSELESSADSVFSRSRSNSSPTGTMFSSSTAVTSPDMYDIPLTDLDSLAVFKPASGRQPLQPQSCTNCQGGSTSKAWSAVRDLRSENSDLRQRVTQLEGTVESCLGLVGGLPV